jgi:hypothetical protein
MISRYCCEKIFVRLVRVAPRPAGGDVLPPPHNRRDLAWRKYFSRDHDDSVTARRPKQAAAAESNRSALA